jgi:hypothetical protein
MIRRGSQGRDATSNTKQNMNRCLTEPTNHDLSSKGGRHTFEQTVNDRVKIDFGCVVPHGKGDQMS